MSVGESFSAPSGDDAFRHEAFLYEGANEFVEGAASFIREGRRAREPVLVVVSATKIDWLRQALGSDADGVVFADMASVGRNPARIIPAWRDFVNSHSDGGPMRGVGEPVWSGRTPDELAECHRHESLLNLAFAGGAPWWLLCPYDTSTLASDVVAEAMRTHPFLTTGTGGKQSDAFVDDAATPFGAPLPTPPTSTADFRFEHGPLDGLRRFVAGHAREAGLDDSRASDLVLAVHEVATNSLRHGGGEGLLRIWYDGDGLVCEVSDRGFLDHPLAGRERPTPDRDDGRGLWLANQLCDLVQLRTYDVGTVVRLRMARS